MKKLSAILILLIFTGCATTTQFASLTPDQRIDFLKNQAVTFLENNKDNIRSALLIIGNEAIHRAVNDADRKEIANQMYSAATAFNSLATGKTVTTDQIDVTLKSFSQGTGSQAYASWISEATLIWGGIFDSLKLSQNQQLVIDYLLIFSSVAQEVAQGAQ